MANPRKPIAAARLSGAYAKNPQRYKNRSEPLVSEPLGNAPEWLSNAEVEVWNEFLEVPWLNRSHRCITAMASQLQAKMMAGALGVPGMQLLRVTLGQLGVTPVDASRISVQPADDEHDDLLD